MEGSRNGAVVVLGEGYTVKYSKEVVLWSACRLPLPIDLHDKRVRSIGSLSKRVFNTLTLKYFVISSVIIIIIIILFCFFWSVL